jgi:hypothetical protein
MLEKLVDLWPAISGNIGIILAALATIAAAVLGIVKLVKSLSK